MNQGELILALSERFFFTKAESLEIIKFIQGEAIAAFLEGGKISLRGFGSFTKKKQSSKKVRHPKTGKIITIPEKITVKFNPSNSLIEKLT